MYLRHVTARGKQGQRQYWMLVESVRHGGKTAQRVVAYLGRLDARERAQASAIARHFLGERAEQPELFEDTSELADALVLARGCESTTKSRIPYQLNAHENPQNSHQNTNKIGLLQKPVCESPNQRRQK